MCLIRVSPSDPSPTFSSATVTAVRGGGRVTVRVSDRQTHTVSDLAARPSHWQRVRRRVGTVRPGGARAGATRRRLAGPLRVRHLLAAGEMSVFKLRRRQAASVKISVSLAADYISARAFSKSSLPHKPLRISRQAKSESQRSREEFQFHLAVWRNLRTGTFASKGEPRISGDISQCSGLTGIRSHRAICEPLLLL